MKPKVMVKRLTCPSRITESGDKSQKATRAKKIRDTKRPGRVGAKGLFSFFLWAYTV